MVLEGVGDHDSIDSISVIHEHPCLLEKVDLQIQIHVIFCELTWLLGKVSMWFPLAFFMNLNIVFLGTQG